MRFYLRKGFARGHVSSLFGRLTRKSLIPRARISGFFQSKGGNMGPGCGASSPIPLIPFGCAPQGGIAGDPPREDLTHPRCSATVHPARWRNTPMSATRTQTIKPGRCPDPTCVVKVGGGRGFVAEYNHALKVPSSFKRGSRLRLRKLTQRLVITAAHCLPAPPPANAASYSEDRTYPKFLGMLDNAPTIAAECLFADPVADIAVLGPPDDQQFGEEAEGFKELMEASPAVRISSLYGGPGTPGKPITRQGWMMSLAGQWIPPC